jgi:hypothetical protein
MTDREPPITPIQRARMREAVRQLKEGLVKIPLACGHCNNPGVIEERQPLRVLTSYDPDALDQSPYDTVAVLRCLACGRMTSLATAHKLRRQKITAFIRRGVDVDVRNPGRRPTIDSG